MRPAALFLVGIVVCIAVLGSWIIVLNEQWVSNVGQFNDLMLSGILIAFFVLGVGLILESTKTKTVIYPGEDKTPRVKKAPPEIDPSNLDPSNKPSPLRSSVNVFEPSILPSDKTIFHRGDWILIRMRFDGILKQGYRAALATFSDKTVEPIYDLATLPDIYAKGTLDGSVSFDERWPWQVPLNAPIGRCELFIAPCTLVKDVPLDMKMRRFGLRLWPKNRRRIDLAKPLRQAVTGETIVITLVE